MSDILRGCFIQISAAKLLYFFLYEQYNFTAFYMIIQQIISLSTHNQHTNTRQKLAGATSYMLRLNSVDCIRHEDKLTGALDSGGEFTLMTGSSACYTVGKDLRTVGCELAELLSVLIVD